MENRENTICPHCECYFTNLDAEQQKDMDEKAPGESCTNGMDVSEVKACPCFRHDGYHRSYIKGERNVQRK